tara:strand:+ start:19291 stop:19566 length:276 start_codon:yes stop_codon:yes gene_type:complete
MKSFIHRRGFRNHQPRESKLMKALIKKGIKSLVEGWGKRQLAKLALAIGPVIAVTQDQLDSTVAVVIAGALMLVEIIFSKLNKTKLEKSHP